MTSLTFNISRSLARTWNPGDEIVVTRLDHDANITPWVMAAQNINLWDGNDYAIRVTEQWGLEESGGMVRIGPVQSNTLEEVGRLREALRGVVK
ncbi:MAG: aminotransferase class V-fold PLP-dependent enzyme [Anaerolineales bacterium]|nr:aminotransferase class V-fold PLP-dependent enzyme [Anaerolineales bacterium]